MFVSSTIHIIHYVITAVREPEFWPEIVGKLTYLYFPILVCFFGVGFTIFLVLTLINLLLVLVAYAATYKSVSDQWGSESENAAILRAYFHFNIIWIPLISLYYCCSSYLQEMADRKEFLERKHINDQANVIIKERNAYVKLQRKLLQNMLPSSIVDQLEKQSFTVSSWNQLQTLSQRHFGVSIMFAELEGFIDFSAQVEPREVIQYLNTLFFEFDGLCDQYDVYKVETFADRYIAVVGVVTGETLKEDGNFSMCTNIVDTLENPSIRDASVSNTKQMLEFAKAIILGSRDVEVPKSKTRPVLRVGIHTGSCMSGIVGTKNFRFTLFGDTMNTAARMEQHSLPGCVHTTQDVVDLVPDCRWEKRAKMDVKGKGAMQTYILNVGKSSCISIDADSGTEAPFMEYWNPVQDDKSEDLTSTSHSDVATLSRVSLGSFGCDMSRYKDVVPVKDDKYNAHTKWFGMAFRKGHVESAFLDSQARLNKNMAYYGYLFYALFLLYNLLYGYVARTNKMRMCRDPEEKRFCWAHYGQGVYDEAQNFESLSYNAIINFSLFRMTPLIGAIFGVLIVMGMLSLSCIVTQFANSGSFSSRLHHALDYPPIIIENREKVLGSVERVCLLDHLLGCGHSCNNARKTAR